MQINYAVNMRASPPLCATPRCPAQCRPHRGCFERRSSAGDNNGTSPAGISEDVLAKLRAAEEEAAALREQLAAAQASVAQARTCTLGGCLLHTNTQPNRLRSTHCRRVKHHGSTAATCAARPSSHLVRRSLAPPWRNHTMAEPHHAFTESTETSWLTEGTMSGYLSKNAPGEGSTKDLTPEEQATVQVIGGAWRVGWA